MDMQKIKVTLLSNTFMSRLAAMAGFHNYLLNTDNEIDQEINNFS